MLLIAYATASFYRLLENPSGKLLPAPSKVIDAAQRLFIEADRRTEHIRLWHDAALSLRRSGNLCVPWNGLDC